MDQTPMGILEPPCQCFDKDGWRELNRGEVIEYGDQYFSGRKWWTLVPQGEIYYPSKFYIHRTRRHLATCPQKSSQIIDPKVLSPYLTSGKEGAAEGS